MGRRWDGLEGVKQERQSRLVRVQEQEQEQECVVVGVLKLGDGGTECWSGGWVVDGASVIEDSGWRERETRRKE